LVPTPTAPGPGKSFFCRFHYKRETWWALDGSLSGQLRNGPAEFLNETVRTYQSPGIRTCQRNPNHTHQLFGTIAYLLENYPVPAALRAALYQALTRLDGVQLIRTVTDMPGRRLPVGTVIDRSVVLETSVVGSRTARPGALTQTP